MLLAPDRRRRECAHLKQGILMKSELNKVKKLKNKLWINCAVLSTNEMRMTAAPEFTYNMYVSEKCKFALVSGGVDRGCE